MGNACNCDVHVETDSDGSSHKRKGETVTIKPIPRYIAELSESDTIIEGIGANDGPTPDDSFIIDQKTRELLMAMNNCSLVSQMSEISDDYNDDEKMIFVQDDFIENAPTMKRLTTIDRNIAAENKRLSTMYNVSTLDELQNVIGKNYDTEGQSETDQSYLDETDKLEIETRKSNEKPTFEELHEMEEQLMVLTRKASSKEMRMLRQSNQLSQDILLVDLGGLDERNDDKVQMVLPVRNLFRDSSGNQWSEPQIEKTMQEMARQMMMLESQNRK